ncbi:helix-turn-helix domain-containing protein [Amycolatopsis kentuckyensis]|uniref:helix-turn-helix domain-containing protein n=1 Tax=Amycolatopsis kentuckyensis TaxID=218823 RepID=UPI001302D5CE|nr:helix-turn-helix transcriptional regulator [Amycolatopsis kentuckyensis]
MESTGPGTYRLVLGRELAALLRASGVSRDDIAAHLDWDATKLSKILQGKRLLRVDEVDKLLQLFNAGAEDAERIRDIAAQARKRGSFGKVPDWSRQYLGLERDAVDLRFYRAELFPGLVQTEEYARHVVSTSPVVAAVDVPRVVEARMRRQGIFERQQPPTLHLIIGEAALKTEVGGPGGLARQLRSVSSLGKSGAITVQVLKASAGAHPALGTDFMILDARIGDEVKTWAYLESLTKADLLDGEQHVNAYRLTFSALSTLAVTPRESLDLIDSAAEDLEKRSE